jgi:hypothetical protein
MLIIVVAELASTVFFNVTTNGATDFGHSGVAQSLSL